MKRIKLNDDIQITDIGLGTMMFGSKIAEGEAIKRMDDFYDFGGNFFDTANIYGRSNNNSKAGDSELILGRWIKLRKNRNKVVVATKVGFPYDDVDYGTNKKKIIQEVDKSLKRLDTDYIDLYYLHTDDRNIDMEESLGTLQELIVAGKIRSIGASNFTAWRLQKADSICEANGWEKFSCIQQRYTYLRPKVDSIFNGQKYVNQDLADFLQSTNKVLIAYCPLVKGAYTNKNKEFLEQYKSVDSQARLKTLSEIAEKYQVSMSTLVYYWLMYNPVPAIPLVAPSNYNQWDEVKKIYEIFLLECDLENLTSSGE